MNRSVIPCMVAILWQRLDLEAATRMALIAVDDRRTEELRKRVARSAPFETVKHGVPHPLNISSTFSDVVRRLDPDAWRPDGGDPDDGLTLVGSPWETAQVAIFDAMYGYVYSEYLTDSERVLLRTRWDAVLGPVPPDCDSA